MKQFIFSLFFFLTTLSASAPHDFFSLFPNTYFVETGSFYGVGIQDAINCGFPRIDSIEIQKSYCRKCRRRFSENQNVKIWCGDSSKILGRVIKNLNAPITFWLDGHYSGGDTGKGSSNSPIMAELDQIQNHPIKTHTILIDDVRQFGTVHFDFITKEAIIEKLLSINPTYKISFHDGYVENDILVASPY